MFIKVEKQLIDIMEESMLIETFEIVYPTGLQKNYNVDGV